MSENANGATIGIGEAAKFTGISVQTLLRFAELGYLRAEQGEAAEVAFRREELRQFFSGREERETDTDGDVERGGGESTLTSTSELTPGALASYELGRESEDYAADLSGKTLSSDQRGAKAQSINSLGFTELAAGTPESVEQAEGAQEIPPDNRASLTIETSSNRDGGAAPHLTEKALVDLIRLQEEILALKDKELADLREQRDWLKRRIECLEDQASRDQVLLLSGSKTIQKLVEAQQPVPKRSGLRGLLEFFGLAAKPEQSGVTPLTLPIETTRDEMENREKGVEERNQETTEENIWATRENRQAANG